MNENAEPAENGRMRNKQEIRRIVKGFASSGKTRREYCEEHGISVATLDYWRRKQSRKPKLMEVAIEPQQGPGFALVLGNGRRIESSWKFAEADLLRLIHAAEA